jgi:small subunit ribosomal protein S30e
MGTTTRGVVVIVCMRQLWTGLAAVSVLLVLCVVWSHPDGVTLSLDPNVTRVGLASCTDPCRVSPIHPVAPHPFPHACVSFPVWVCSFDSLVSVSWSPLVWHPPLTGKVHGSLARAGKVKSQTPKVEKTDKKKKPRGRANKRLLYNRRFVNIIVGPGKKKSPNANS